MYPCCSPSLNVAANDHITVDMFSFYPGSIIDCCRQGETAGRTSQNNPVCIEKNIDYASAGRVSKSMCLIVFKSCCRNSAREKYCTAGVQAAINGLQCETASEIGGQMKLGCCECCKKGLVAGSLGQSCDQTIQGDILCIDSFTACCKNFQVKVNTTVTDVIPTTSPVNEATTKEVPRKDCNALGCEQKCEQGDGNKVKCSCLGGYRLKADQKSCEDINECESNNAVCDQGNICQNRPGSYICVEDPISKEKPCKKSGFIRKNGVCVDEDECETGSANCGDKYCINAVGYYACFDVCPFGYQAQGKICKDVDECASQGNLCGHNYKCVNTIGYYACKLASCQKGYVLKNDKCEDIDECALGTHDCGKNYKCENTVGYYECKRSACDRGFVLWNDRCQDINECLVSPNICGRGRCFNNYGSYTCVCARGFALSTTTNRCEDINECKRSPGICESDCVNTLGSYRCSCPSGYQTIGDHCEDIDECSSGARRCPSDHVCYNEYGNYSCIQSSCPNKYYILKSSYECRLQCPRNHGPCSELIIQSIKWRATKFKKFVSPRAYKFTYVLRVSSYLPFQINFKLTSGNENKEFYLQRVDKHTVDLINIKKLVGPKRYVLRMDVDVLFRGKVYNKEISRFSHVQHKVQRKNMEETNEEDAINNEEGNSSQSSKQFCTSPYWALIKYVAPLTLTLMAIDIGEQALNRSLSSSVTSVKSLAAFGLAYMIIKLTTGLISEVKLISIMLIHNTATRRKVMACLLVVGLSVCLMNFLIGFTKFGVYLIDQLHQVPPDVGLEARNAILYLSAFPLVDGIAWLHTGILLKYKYSLTVGFASIIDNVFQVLTVVILLQTNSLSRNVIIIPVLATYLGTLARLFTVLIAYYKCIHMGLASSLPQQENEKPLTVKRIITLWAPLGLVQLAQRLCRPIINLFVARDRSFGMTRQKAVEAVAVLSVCYPIGHLPYGWLNTLRLIQPAFKKRKVENETKVTVRNINIFSFACFTLSFVMMLILFWVTGISTSLLVSVSNVDQKIIGRARDVLRVFAFFPILVASRAGLTGMFVSHEKSKYLYPSVPSRFVGLLGSLFAFPHLGVQGSIMGIASLFAAFFGESLLVLIMAVVYRYRKAVPRKQESLARVAEEEDETNI
eukprot:gene7130-7936_t